MNEFRFFTAKFDRHSAQLHRKKTDTAPMLGMLALCQRKPEVDDSYMLQTAAMSTSCEAWDVGHPKTVENKV